MWLRVSWIFARLAVFELGACFMSGNVGTS